MTNLTSLSSHDEGKSKPQAHRSRHCHDRSIRKNQHKTSDHDWTDELAKYSPDIDDVLCNAGSKSKCVYPHGSEFGWNKDRLKIFMQLDGISLLVLLMLLGRQLLFKPFFSTLVMVLMLSVPYFTLNIILDSCKNYVDFDLVVKQYYIGFGKGFLLLLAIDFCFAGLLFSHVSQGEKWRASMEVEAIKPVEALFEDIFRSSPITGIAFAFFASFFIAGLLEESIKLLFMISPSKTLSRAIMGHGRSISQQGTLIYIISFSLGLATAENCFYLGNSSSNLYHCLKLALDRVVFSMPMHVACACITSERIYQYEGSFFRVVWPSVMLHGIFDFQIMLISGLMASDILSPVNGKIITVTASTVLVLVSWNICRKAFRGKLVANGYRTV